MGKRKSEMDVMISDTARVVLVERRVENPNTTEALVEAALDAGQHEPRWMPAFVNQVTLMGGAARMKGLSPAQRAVAARWRSLTDRSTIGGAQATDYSAVRVDTSGGGRDVAEDGAEARRELMIARRHVGPFLASILDRVICEGMSVREAAGASGLSGGNGQLLTSKRVREGLDLLVELYASRRRLRRAGDVAEDWTLPVDGEEPAKAH